MSSILELTETPAKNETHGNGSNGVKPFLINVEMYHSMIEHGILTTLDKVELLNGEIIEKESSGKKHRLTTAVYDAMVEYGILTENDNVELINGEIIEKMPKGTKHSITNDLMTEFFYLNLSGRCLIRNQNPILMGDSEPEPDLVLCKLPRQQYLSRHPFADDIYLLVEVSDSTLYLDRNIKGKLYAEAGISQYLIVNVLKNTIEDYRQPSEAGFQSKQTYKIGDSFSLVAFPEIEIKVGDFFSVDNFN